MLLFTEVTIWSLGDKRVHWPVPKLYNWLCPSFINTLALGRAHSWNRPSQENHYFDQTVKLNIFSFKTYNLVSAGRCSSLREFLSQNICCSPHPKGLAFASAWEVRSRASHPKPSWLLNSDASIAPLFFIFTILKILKSHLGQVQLGFLKPSAFAYKQRPLSRILCSNIKNVCLSRRQRCHKAPIFHSLWEAGLTIESWVTRRKVGFVLRYY